jgi:hypothetical protein
MALVTKTYTFTAGTTIVASEHNTNFDTLYNLVNGNIDNANIKASAGIVDSKLAQLTTAGKVSGVALTSLASIPSGAGVIPIANLATGTPAGNKFVRDDGTLQLVAPPYIKFSNTQSSGTGGGSGTSGGWNTVPINTKDQDTTSIASLASNQMTLPSGTYQIRSFCPFSRTDKSQSRLRNVTDGSTIFTGQSLIAQNSISQDFLSIIIGQFTLSASKAIELQYQVQTTVATNGLGNSCSFGTEVYAQIEFFKIG